MHSGVYDKNGIVIRLFYLAAAIGWYVLTLGGQFTKKKRIVLCYHAILSSHRERFAWQVKKISNRKSQNIRLTFDDAFANLLDNAVPVLRKENIPCTIFAVSGNLGQLPNWKMPEGHPESYEKTMTAEQLISLSKHRLTIIGSHTLTHPDLAKITLEDAGRELIQSRNDLEMLLSCPIEELALPHGSYNDAVLMLAREAGYRRIYTLQPYLVSDAAWVEGIIGRFSMSPDVWKIEFLLTCAGAYSWLAKWRWLVSFVKRCIRRVKKSC